MTRFETDFEASHYGWLVQQLARKQAAATEASDAVTAVSREIRHKFKKKKYLQLRVQKAAREVTAATEAIENFHAEEAKKWEVRFEVHPVGEN